MHMACTLSGSDTNTCHTFSVPACVSTSTVPVFPATALTCMLGSAVAYSLAYCAPSFRTISHTPVALPGSTMICAELEAAIAVSREPPSSAASRKSSLAASSQSMRPISALAFARPLSISTPEWPLVSALITISTAAPVTASRATGTVLRTLTPPAQLHIKIPSYSESKLMSL